MGEIVFASHGMSTKPCFVGMISWALLTKKQGYEPGSKGETPASAPVAGTMNNFVRDMFWHSTKP